MPAPLSQPSSSVTFVECPRDSWQGLTRFIPTAEKISYLTALLNAGFDHLDLGSFVSAKAVPQLADTEAVLAELPEPDGRDYLCIVANAKGLERAATQPKVTSVGYPLSVSDAFQRRNTNRSLEESWPLVKELREETDGAGKRFVVYLSMGFGNPDGEAWNVGVTLDAIARLRDLGVTSVAIADTVGRASPELVGQVCAAATDRFGPDGLGVHLHARAQDAVPLVLAARNAGVEWFEGALGGVGGCPFAGDALVGNLPTEGVASTLNLPYAQLPELAERAKALRERYA